jgi:hypothetical protein
MTGAEIVKKYEALEGNAHGNWLNLWQECQDWAMPTNDNINRIRVEGQEKPPQRMIDSCIEANYNFASGFFSHMFPPNTIWAKYRHPDPNIMKIQSVATYFEKVSRMVHQTLIGSNFAQEEFQALLCMGSLGTNIVSVESDDKSIVKFRNYVCSKIVLDENYLGEVDTVGRKIDLKPRQAVQQFGEDALRKAGLGHVIEDAKNVKETKYKFIHMVCPREDYDKSKKDAKNKPFASLYVSCDTKQIVKEGGFSYNPYKVGRFTTGNDEVYGRSPMSMILGTARRTNVIYRSMIVSAEQNSNPQWLVPDDDSVKGLSGRAGAVIKWRATNPNGRPERLQSNGDANIAYEMYQLHDDQIKRMFFNHLFRPLEDYRNMTATEVNERMTTDMMTLAPFVARYLDEHVSPMMEQIYYILQEKGLLPDPPAELADNPSYEIDYVGRLALATKSFESLGAIQAARIFIELGQGDPEFLGSMDYLDKDKMFINTYFSNSGSMDALNDEDEVEAEREARAQQMQQQQAIANLAPVADATQKLSGAVDPNSPLAQMAG